MRPTAVWLALALAFGAVAPPPAASAAVTAIPWQRVPADVAFIGGATPGITLRDLAVGPSGLIAAGKDVRGPGAATARAAAVTASNGRIYLFNRSGGRILVYDPDRATWANGPSVPSGRWVFGASAGPGRLISVATYLGATGNWLYTLDPLTGRWRSRGATSYPAPVAWDAAGMGYAVNTTRALAVESATGRAHPKAPTPFVAGGVQAAPGPRGLVWSVGYAFGNPSGARTSESMTQVAQAYDPATDSWALGPQPPRARWGMAVVGIGDRLYVIGGRPSSTVGSAEVLVVDATAPGG